jgi:CPA1 family monovalent cation:H+ antiporter
VIFISVFEIADGAEPTVSGFATLFAEEAIGGIALGAFLGWLVRYLLVTIDNHVVEVLITLAAVIGGYSLAITLHISGPLAMVVSGLFISSPYHAENGRSMVSHTTEEYLHMFWEMVDELLNAFLFMLIGLELLAIPFDQKYLLLGIVSIFLVLAGRAIALAFPIATGSIRSYGFRRALTVLTWGGLKGGISVALALSLTDEMSRDLIVTVTYIIVVFSIIVQGLTIQPLLQKFGMSTITPRDEANIGREIVPHDENPVVKDPEKSENRIK